MRSLAAILIAIAATASGCAYPHFGFADGQGGEGEGGAGPQPKPAINSGGGECAPSHEQIYLVTASAALYRFAPTTLTFTKVGDLDCPSTGHPWSMALDRRGTAWVLYSDGHLFKASVEDARCSATAYVPDQQSYHLFGMAFVADASSSSGESLFVSDKSRSRLGRIDTGTLQVHDVGAFGVDVGASDLTGTGGDGSGSGRLFAMFYAEPPSLAEIDWRTGKIVQLKSLPGLSMGSWFGIGQWSGDVWLFTERDGGTRVRRFGYDKAVLSAPQADLGFVVVGAGSSTCSPR